MAARFDDWDDVIAFACGLPDVEMAPFYGTPCPKVNGKAFVSISNRGDTISPEELPFLFDRFRKADKSRSKDRDGYGLGLAIVKTILNNHNEDVTVTSRDGLTEFIFTAKLKEK